VKSLPAEGTYTFLPSNFDTRSEVDFLVAELGNIELAAGQQGL
jgi:hypothetical protein